METDKTVRIIYIEPRMQNAKGTKDSALNYDTGL
mgnify:CR=1 FL=1